MTVAVDGAHLVGEATEGRTKKKKGKKIGGGHVDDFVDNMPPPGLEKTYPLRSTVLLQLLALLGTGLLGDGSTSRLNGVNDVHAVETAKVVVAGVPAFLALGAGGDGLAGADGLGATLLVGRVVVPEGGKEAHGGGCEGC